MALHGGRCTLGAYLAVALLAGCSGVPATPDGRAAVPASPRAADVRGTKPWMAVGASAQDLLYVTNGNDGQVDIYSYPSGVFEGHLPGFSYAYGGCTDAKGNVYITDFKADTVVEYAHGATQPTRTLSVPGIGPAACAVDPVGGNLAVTTTGSISGVGANVAVFRKAKGVAKAYTYAAIFSYGYCTYDGAGDLFVDGTPAHGYGYDYELAELARGAKSLEAVNLEYGMSWGGALQWDGHYLAVGHPILPQIQRYTIGARYGTYVGSTPLADAYNAFQFIIVGRKTVVANLYYYDRYIVRWDVLLFDYPSGGELGELVNADSQVLSVSLSRRRR